MISLSALFASAQPGGHTSSYAGDTVKTSFLNRSTYEVYDRNKQLIQRVQLKNEERHGYAEIYQNGLLIEKTRYKKGKKNGDSDKYHTNGIKHISAQYKNGFLSGKYKEYYNSGSLRLEAVYKIFTIDTLKKSLYHGSSTTYIQNGEVFSEGDYDQGKKTGVWKEYYQGKLLKSETYKDGEKHGPYVEYQRNGILQRRGTYYRQIDVDGEVKNNIQDGKIERYYNNGQLENLEFYKMGKRHGKFESFKQDGRLYTIKFFEDDEPTGTWQSFDNESRLMNETNYKIFETEEGKKGLKDGLYRRWNNGVLVGEMPYEKDLAHGTEKTWHRDGSLASEKQWENGVPVGKAVDYHKNGNEKWVRHYKTILNNRNENKTITEGWSYNYDIDGEPLNLYFSNSLGENIIHKSYYNGKFLGYSISNFLSLEYAPGGSLNSLIVGTHPYYPTLGMYYFMDGNIRKTAFQNPEIGIENYVDFSYTGDIISIYSATHDNADSLNASIETVERIIEKIGKKLIPNSFYTDSVKDGEYVLKYADNSVAARMHFENDIPNGEFVFHGPLNGDTLWYEHYEMGYPTGYYVQKYGGEDVLYRGVKRKYGLPNDSERYSKLGVPQSSSFYIPADSSIEKTTYYPDGQLERHENDERGYSYSYDREGNPTYERYFSPTDSTLKISEHYHVGSNQLRSLSFYRNNKQDSISMRYYPSGQILFETNYRNNERNGEYKEYHEDGSLKRKGIYENGKREGAWVEMTDNKIDTLYYNTDRLIIKPSDLACECIDTTQASGTIGFAPSLNYLLDYSKFKSRLPGYIVPVDSLNYHRIFYTGMQSSGDFLMMNLIMYAPFSFSLPANEQIKLTLNPCRTKGYLSRMQVSVSSANKDHIYTNLSPERISMEFLKGPTESADNDYPHFTAFFGTKDISHSPVRKLEIDYDSNSEPCFTKAKIKNFLTVKTLNANPFIFKNPRNQTAISHHLKLSEIELEDFFGLSVSEAEIYFHLDDLNATILATSDCMLIGGKYAAGKISLPCAENENGEYELTDTIGKIQVFTPEALRMLWLKKGFTRLKFELDQSSNNLSIYFFAE